MLRTSQAHALSDQRAKQLHVGGGAKVDRRRRLLSFCVQRAATNSTCLTPLPSASYA
jgi:hypothetical protein